MIYELNETHDPGLKCRIRSAHDPATDFPIQNLPFGVFVPNTGNAQPRIGVAIGDSLLDLAECGKRGLLDELPPALAAASTGDSLNGLMTLSPELWSLLRRQVSRLLRADGFSRSSVQIEAALVARAQCRMLLPARIGDYTDFYASIHHARNVGSMFRPDNPLLPNYKYVPVGYHGRASSIVVSGSPVRRPSGQTEGPDSVPVFGPSRLLDYELEIGAFTGPGNSLGQPIPIVDAESHLFGLCLVNDWSARDIQKWEYQPLGPFLAKSFCTTISPWVVTMEALVPYRVPAAARIPGDPPSLPYLTSEDDSERGGVNLGLEVFLCSERMRSEKEGPVLLSRSNMKDLYWTLAQLLTHHASNGCNLRPGDLLASGTVSGPDKGSRGCLLELTWRGTDPVLLPGDDSRRFLEDGDEVILRGRAERAGFVSIGMGECRGRIEQPETAK
jgi:fumarylacetoacetase